MNRKCDNPEKKTKTFYITVRFGEIEHCSK